MKLVHVALDKVKGILSSAAAVATAISPPVLEIFCTPMRAMTIK